MSSSSKPIPFGGFVAPGFEKVEKVFKANFEKGLELGSSYVAYLDGKCVVNLIGGWADKAKTKPFGDKTLTTVFSSGKAVLGVTIAHLVSKGLIRYDDLVCQYWPEFAAGGKEHVMIKDLCQHSAGVAWLDKEHNPTVDDILDLDRLARKIATQPHNFHGEYHKLYHSITQGWYLNEIVRRRLGKSHGQFMKEDVNKQLGVEVYCGFDTSNPALEDRYSPVVTSPGLYKFLTENIPPPNHVSRNIGKTSTGVPPNDKKLRMGESPAGHTVSNAQSLARLAALCSMGGTLDGVTLIDESTLHDSVALELRGTGLKDVHLDMVPRTCVGGTSWVRSPEGFLVPTEHPSEYMKGPGWEWTGWFGYGGSHMQFDVKNRAASSYVMNLLQASRGADTRGADLVLAFVQCVEAQRKGAKGKL
ncbi:hypothetical protein HDU93_003593 [Gonapodya sp. JEL0774]|nr:hypothetical protein HDU93_003593 [Gonapodya sp. JEL0774]